MQNYKDLIKVTIPISRYRIVNLTRKDRSGQQKRSDQHSRTGINRLTNHKFIPAREYSFAKQKIITTFVPDKV